jgi:hypothetical protein
MYVLYLGVRRVRSVPVSSCMGCAEVRPVRLVPACPGRRLVDETPEAAHFRAEGGRLHLVATDMELSPRSSLNAQVDGEGSVVVPCRLLVDLVRLLPDSEGRSSIAPKRASSM